MSDPQEELQQKKRVIKWLSFGVAGVALVIAAIAGLGAFGDQQAEELEKITVSDVELTNAKAFSERFILTAGTFGLNQENVSQDALSFASELTTENEGFYGNPAFGLSRGEVYRDSVIPKLDPRGEEDVTDYFAEELKQYYPDWSGQLSSYTAKDVNVTVGSPYAGEGATLIPVRTSFNSVLDIYKPTSGVGPDSKSWEHYRAQTPLTVTMVLSLQSDGNWLLWSISDLDEEPYSLVTWSEPNWRVTAPEVALMQKVE